METRANYVWVGAVSLGLLALLAGLALWLAHLARGDPDYYDIYFHQSVSGLSNGTAVSYAGVPAGKVTQIELWRPDPSFVRVRVAVESKFPILQGTTATIEGSFTGVSDIQLGGGVKGAPAITQAGPDGVPVIPTKRSGLGELLNNAPLLLDRLATLTERLTMVLSDQNQKSVSNILEHTDKITASLADASPQMKSTLTQLQSTLAQATQTLASFQALSASANRQLDPAGPSVVHQMTATLKSAQAAADSLQTILESAKPATKQLSESTLPQAEATLRDLRAAAKALHDMTEKLQDHGAGSLIGGSKLPEYKP